VADQIKTIWIGLDWGTHSSKWWYTAENLDEHSFGPSAVPAVVDSTVSGRHHLKAGAGANSRPGKRRCRTPPEETPDRRHHGSRLLGSKT